MTTDKINQIIDRPELLSQGDLPALQQLVEDYPWCATFQVLLAKAMKMEHEPGFQKQLKKTAIYSADRKVLYRLIMQPDVQASIAAFDALTESQSESKEATPSSQPTAVQNPSKSEDKFQAKPVEEDMETDEDSLLDTQNLEREVLAQVAAQSYQFELESEAQTTEHSESGQPASLEYKAQDAHTRKDNRPMTFIDFISGGTSASMMIDSENTEEEERSLIDRFIQNEPKIERKSADFFSPVNMGKMSLAENEEMVTETLAGIYARQGDIEKARRAYKQLALKYPEKSSYFAGLEKKLGPSKSKK